MALQIDPQTETAVANEALSTLLVPGITDLSSDQSQKGTVLRRHFAPVRDTIQSQYPWNFCEQMMVLQPDPVNKPPFRFQYFYNLPNNPYCLNARSIWECDRPSERKWRVQGRRIATNIGPCLHLLFTARVPEVPLWSAVFRQAYVLGLASACVELCKDENIANNIAERAANALTMAFPVDAGEGTEDDPAEPDIIMARF